MSKRRIFDINFPDTAGPATNMPAVKPSLSTGRRGPMASAIGENAEALRERQDAENEIRAENDALAHEHVRLKKLGLIVDLIPLSEIKEDKLTRDRAQGRDPELDELKDSIKAIGLSNPIRVEQTENGYQLVQGFRRLTAYRELLAETKDETYGRIPAGLVARGEALERLYRQMVDENLVRRDISFAEMAALAQNYAADPGTTAQNLAEAVAVLFGSAGRQKRAYIRNFAQLLDRVGGSLKHPEAIARALGLSLLKEIEGVPGAAAILQKNLQAKPERSAEEELVILRATIETSPNSRVKKPVKPGGAKTTFRLSNGAEVVKCTASDGRLEVLASRDFSTQDRQKLEAAVAAFFSVLDEE